MKLFLASEVKHPNTIKKLKEFIGGFGGKNIAYIPTAANGENNFGEWRNHTTWQMVNKLKANVSLLQLEDYRDDSVIKEIKGKDIVWFSGGVPGYLMYWIKRCSIDKYINKIIEDGTIFVGSSAGAMVAGQSLDAASWEFVDGEHGSELIEPMRLVNFDIYPHYEELLLPQIKENYKGKKLYLLKNGEEIIVEDGKVEVIGEERMIQNV
jgi:dipeptidase E